MEDEKLIIIPDVVTLDAMDEFSLMTEANYKLAFVHDDGSVEATEYPITYAGIMDVAVNGTDINDYLASVGVESEDSDYGNDDVTEAFEPVGSSDEDDYDYGDGDDDIFPEDEDAPFGSEPDDEPSYDDASDDESAVGEDVDDEPAPAVEQDVPDFDEPDDFDGPVEESIPAENDDRKHIRLEQA